MPRDVTMSWMVEHFNNNKGHTVRETIELPPHCVTCGAKSPIYDLEVIPSTFSYTPETCPLGEHLLGMAYDAKRDLFVCRLCGFEASAEMGGI